MLTKYMLLACIFFRIFWTREPFVSMGEAGADDSKILLYPAKNVLAKNVFLLPAIFIAH